MPLLAIVHRWWGVVFCLLFAMWFASGIVMHFVPFPARSERPLAKGMDMSHATTAQIDYDQWTVAGDFDFACDMPPDQIAAIESNPKLEVVGGPIMNIRLTIFDKHHPVLKEPRVRQAMTHAIDRQAIVDALWAGRTRVPKGLQWDFFGPMLLADWAPPAFDPAEARKLLKEAG